MDAELQTAIENEQALANLLDELKSRIASAVQETPSMPGVIPISDNPRVAVVCSSALFGSAGKNLSSRYYMQGAQADAVVSAVASCRTVTELLERLRVMVENQKVEHGADAGTQLNEKTVQVLREFIS